MRMLLALLLLALPAAGQCPCSCTSGGLFLGLSAGTLATGQPNAGVGNSALYALTTGTYNAAFGDHALAAVTTGSFNTAFGHHVLGRVTTGGFNTAVGEGAGEYLTTESRNTILGQYAMVLAHGGASSNTALGYHALSDSQSGASGSFNVAVGDWAGAGISSGSNNTFVGSTAGVANQKADARNATAIGDGAYTVADDTVALGGPTVIDVLAGSTGRATVRTAQVVTPLVRLTGEGARPACGAAAVGGVWRTPGSTVDPKTADSVAVCLWDGAAYAWKAIPLAGCP